MKKHIMAALQPMTRIFLSEKSNVSGLKGSLFDRSISQRLLHRGHNSSASADLPLHDKNIIPCNPFISHECNSLNSCKVWLTASWKHPASQTQNLRIQTLSGSSFRSEDTGKHILLISFEQLMS